MLMLQAYNHKIPPFNGALFVELYQAPSGEYQVKVLHRNDTHHPPYVLQLPGESITCYLADLCNIEPVIQPL